MTVYVYKRNSFVSEKMTLLILYVNAWFVIARLYRFVQMHFIRGQTNCNAAGYKWSKMRMVYLTKREFLFIYWLIFPFPVPLWYLLPAVNCHWKLLDNSQTEAVPGRIKYGRICNVWEAFPLLIPPSPDSQKQKKKKSISSLKVQTV